MITANPDITKIKNENVDFIIMGCDGIWEVKTNAEMVEWIRKRLENNAPLQNITEELLDELVSKDNGNQYGMDNMSSILIKFNKKK
jgi:serine/threonine protein phosphatase PrpC